MLKHRAFYSHRYHEAAQLCSDALAMDRSGQHYKQPRRACPAAQRGAIESLLRVAEGKAQAQQLLARASDEMAARDFARAVDTLSDALLAEPPAAAAAAAATAASAITTLAAAAAGSSTAAAAAAVSEAERARIAALRGEAAHKAAESDLRRRGAEAFAGTSYSATVCQALSDSEKAKEENRALCLNFIGHDTCPWSTCQRTGYHGTKIPQHLNTSILRRGVAAAAGAGQAQQGKQSPHPYWNPSEARRQDPHYRGHTLR
jgi:hypothetical protein